MLNLLQGLESDANQVGRRAAPLTRRTRKVTKLPASDTTDNVITSGQTSPVDSPAGWSTTEFQPGRIRPLQPAAMREVNMGSLLRALRVLGAKARVELSDYTGISPATVTKLVASLTEANIVVERANTSTQRATGRPRVPVDFASGSRVALGLHLGADSATVAVVDLRGTVLSQRTNAYPAGSGEKIVQSAARGLNRIRRGLGAGVGVVGVGVSSDGDVDQVGGVLRSHPSLDWGDVPVADLVAEVSELPVEYDRTVRGQALAAIESGQGQIVDLVHLAVNGRVESALVLGTTLYRGTTGTAGLLEHWPVPGVRGPACGCGQNNCLATVAGDDGLSWLARDRGVIAADEGYDELVAAATSGSRTAVNLLRSRAQWIGRALATLGDLLDPATIALSGSAQDWAPFSTEVGEALDKAPGRTDATRLQALPEAVTPVAASAALFLERYFEDPVRYEPELQRRLLA